MHVIILASTALVGIVVGSLWHVEPRPLLGVCAVGALSACLAGRQPHWRMLALVACASALGALRTTLMPPPATQPTDQLDPYLGTRVRLRAQVAEIPRLVGGGAYARLVLVINAVGPSGQDPSPLDFPASAASPQVVVLADPATRLAGLVQGELVTLEGRMVATADGRGPPVVFGAQVVDPQAGQPVGLSAQLVDPQAGQHVALGQERIAADAAGAVSHRSAAGDVDPARPAPQQPADATYPSGAVSRPPAEAADQVGAVSQRSVAGAVEQARPASQLATDATNPSGAPSRAPAEAVDQVGAVSKRSAEGGLRSMSSERWAAWTSNAQSTFADWMRQLGSVRQAASANIQRYLPEPQASLAVGVLLGGAGRLSPDFKIDLQRSGLSHVLAIDGYKQILVAGLVWALATRFFGVRIALLTTVALTTGYTLLTGAHPSAVRAALMLALACLATLTGRVADPLTSLALVVLALAAIEPPMLFDVGLQLSVSATLGIILLWPRLRRRLQRLPRWIAEPLGLSAAVTLATLPVTLSAFQFVSFVSPIAHVVALPLLPLVLAGTTLLAVLAAAPPPSEVVAWLATLPTAADLPWLPPFAAPFSWFAALPAWTVANLPWLSNLSAVVTWFTAPPGEIAAHWPGLSHLTALVIWLAELPALTVAQSPWLSTLAALATWHPSLPPVFAFTSPIRQLAPLSPLTTWLTNLQPDVAASTFVNRLPSPVLVAAWLAWLPTSLLASVIHVFGSMPAAGVSTGRLPPPAALALAAALLGYGVWQLPELATLRMGVRHLKSNHRKLPAPSACAAACVGATALLRLLQPDGQLHVEPLRLSRGQAVFIRGPTGATALVVSGQPSAASLTSQVAQNLLVWEHQLNMVVALDATAEKALAPTLTRYPADKLIRQQSWQTPQRLDLGRGAAVDVWTARGQLRVAIDETTSVPTTSAARPGSAD